MRNRNYRKLALFIVFSSFIGCNEQSQERLESRETPLLLEDARTCSSGFTYPQDLIDGLSYQLIEELRCMDDRWLEFYVGCEEVGCINPYGPQPLALRPEVLVALRELGNENDDFITISAGYRDVAMQYYSRWYNENCDSAFNAEVPGQSNHQGGRAIDVRYYDFWSELLLTHGFEHPIPTDEPHFEFLGDEIFREDSERLKVLSVLAFQRLWNRNNPTDPLETDGIYDEETKIRLGGSPVEGFALSGCDPNVEDDVGIGDIGINDVGINDTGINDTQNNDTEVENDPENDIENDTEINNNENDAETNNNESDTANIEITDVENENVENTENSDVNNSLATYSRMSENSTVETGCSITQQNGSRSRILFYGVFLFFLRKRKHVS